MSTRTFRIPRRSYLYGLGATLGTAALNALFQQDKTLAAADGPLAERSPHHPARAKACIFLFMEGGPSHLDTFDPKPKLDQLHMQSFTREDKFASNMASGKRYYVRSPFTFAQYGASGQWMCTNWEHLSKLADDLCVYKGCQAESVDHPTACYHLNTGNRFGGDPAIGAWVTYGLGTIDQNLPAFVVLPEGAFPQGGAANWSNGFLPAHYQGTALRSHGSPILDLQPPEEVTDQQQRANLDLLAQFNASHASRHPHQSELAARIASYELAYRMQTAVPEALSLQREDQRTLDMYGIGVSPTDSFGRRCLLARKLVQSGVRFVQLFEGGWDSHDYIERAHGSRIRTVDKPIAALLTDLKRLGLLEETLVIWGGEFGRSPDNGIRGGGDSVIGRDHNAKGMNLWLAGGGVQAGRAIGATDEIGEKAVEVVHPLKDLHCTILHLLGLNDNQLTYFHEGRHKQLSQTGGAVIRELIA